MKRSDAHNRSWLRLVIGLFALGMLLLPQISCAARQAAITKLGYAIQMGAFADVKNAERFAARLQAKGIEAFYFRKDNGVYAVRFGDFPSKEKARSIAAKLVKDRLIDSYYVASPQEIVFPKPKEPGFEKAPSPELRPVPPPKELPVVGEQKPKTDSPRAAKKERDMGNIAARTAERFVGIPYQWGGNTVVDGLDCSGFVRAVYNLCGVSIPRTSREQFKVGSTVAKDDLKDGDLLFFGSSVDAINHVGIYVGNGKFVHAPRRGEEIRVAMISEAYFDKRYVGARRYF